MGSYRVPGAMLQGLLQEMTNRGTVGKERVATAGGRPAWILTTLDDVVAQWTK